MAQHLANERMAFGLEYDQRKRDILGGQSRSVLEARLRPEEETVGQLIRRNLDGTGNETVEGVWFIQASGHQRVEDEAHPGCAVPLENIDVQCIESREVLVPSSGIDLQRNGAAL